MTLTVQTFNCSRCNRGEFRSLPGADGKAYCPWCGDAVGGGAPPAAPSTPTPVPAPAPAVAAPETPVASFSLEQLVDRVAISAPENVVRALRDRVADLSRACERAQADLRQELDKKEQIKKVVMEEVGKLGSQVGETKVLLRRKEEDHISAVTELSRLKEDLEKEREKVAELSKARGSLEAVEEITRNLESKLEERRKSVRELEDGREAARRDAEQLRSDFAKARANSEAQLADLTRKIAASESRLGILKDADVQVGDLKAKVLDGRRRLEKERAESQEKISTLQADLEKRDQRIRELQMLIKTLGERLNDLSARRP